MSGAKNNLANPNHSSVHETKEGSVNFEQVSSLLEQETRAEAESDTKLAQPTSSRPIPQNAGEYSPGIPYEKIMKLRTAACGKATPSKLAPGEAPVQQRITSNEPRPFICPICHQGRTRLQHLETHFPVCVEAKGNPNGLHYFDHASTLKYISEGKRPF